MAHPTATETTPLIESQQSIVNVHQNDTSQISPDGITTSRSLDESRAEDQTFRIAATMFSFVILGLFTASTGVMLPPLTAHYDLTDLQVSTLFLITPAGYILSASSNSLIHSRYGQRGVALLGPLLQILSALVIAAKPKSFLGILVGWGIMAMGAGLLDGSWCAMAGAMGSRANRVSGFLHGSFSVGAATGPFVVGAFMAKGVEWWVWYCVLTGASLLELIILLAAFRNSNATAYHQAKPPPPMLNPSSKIPSKRTMFSHSALWISALYFLTYVGNETAISGWIVSFMTRARHASPYLSSISSSGYWAGMAIGRLVLGHVTDQIGVRKGAVIYLSCAILLQVLFAVIHSPAVSIVLASLLGFTMGPLFPSGVVVLTQLLPKELHIKAVSIVSSVGQIGGAALPFGIGAVVQKLGIRVFCWVLIVFSSVSLALWCVFAGMKPEHGVEDADERGYIVVEGVAE